MSFKSGDKVLTYDFNSLNDGITTSGKVISVNGDNIWVMLDSGKQVLRWPHEVRQAGSSSEESLSTSS